MNKHCFMNNIRLVQINDMFTLAEQDTKLNITRLGATPESTLTIATNCNAISCELPTKLFLCFSQLFNWFNNNPHRDIHYSRLAKQIPNLQSRQARYCTKLATKSTIQTCSSYCALAYYNDQKPSQLSFIALTCNYSHPAAVHPGLSRAPPIMATQASFPGNP